MAACQKKEIYIKQAINQIKTIFCPDQAFY